MSLAEALIKMGIHMLRASGYVTDVPQADPDEGCPSKVEILNADGTVSGVMRCRTTGPHGYHQGSILIDHCMKRAAFWNQGETGWIVGKLVFRGPHGEQVLLRLRSR